ncbi:hypothetical protein [Commensalibacter papalotli (ex Botero et al. 2024)]|uniref:hypothetical protein n=1 Tax=Commensalibacter papalotli (ex Botero et al. 2024) TaxID=2972766 RepID=UPI002492577B|nr:hypothetical protein [Commensalibacter papalotli (ex Botero et al. 2024)]
MSCSAFLRSSEAFLTASAFCCCKFLSWLAVCCFCCCSFICASLACSKASLAEVFFSAAAG